MTFHPARTMLSCLALALAMSGTAAMAANDPIPGVDVIVKSHPAGLIILRVHTDGSGRARLEGLLPGNYVLTVRDESLAAAMDRLAAPARGGGARAGVGSHGLRSEEGATPAERGGSQGSGSHGGGGATAGTAVGDFNHDGVPDVAARGGPVIQVVLDLAPAGRFSRTASYRRDHAGEGLELAFTIPRRGGARSGLARGTVLINAISDQASAGNLSSY